MSRTTQVRLRRGRGRATSSQPASACASARASRAAPEATAARGLGAPPLRRRRRRWRWRWRQRQRQRQRQRCRRQRQRQRRPPVTARSQHHRIRSSACNRSPVAMPILAVIQVVVGTSFEEMTKVRGARSRRSAMNWPDTRESALQDDELITAELDRRMASAHAWAISNRFEELISDARPKLSLMSSRVVGPRLRAVTGICCRRARVAPSPVRSRTRARFGGVGECRAAPDSGVHPISPRRAPAPRSAGGDPLRGKRSRQLRSRCLPPALLLPTKRRERHQHGEWLSRAELPSS